MQIIIAMLVGGAVSAWMCDSPVAPGADGLRCRFILSLV